MARHGNLILAPGQVVIGSLRKLADTQDLRVAHIIGHLSVGGAEKYFVSLLNNLSFRNRWAVFTAAKRDGPHLYDQLDPAINRKVAPIRKRTAIFDIFSLARFLRQEGVDVVHAHMFWSNLYGCVAARIAGVPVVVTTEHGENKWKKARHRWLERNVISRCTGRRFCVSGSILERRQHVDGVPSDLLEVTSNGTEIPENPATLAKHESPLIGTVGRIVPQKDHPLFVATIAELRRRGRNVRACIVGGGPGEKEVKDCLLEAKLNEVVRMPGMSDDVDAWYRQFDIYLVSSSEEGQPVSLLEAMSYGLPIVATDVGAIAQTVRHGEEGLIAPPGDANALADAICRYLDDPEFAVKCGERARLRAISEYSIAAIAARYEQVYMDLLARHRSGDTSTDSLEA